MPIIGRISDARFTFITIQKTSVLYGATKRRHVPTWMDAALSIGVATVMDGKSKNTII
jgi:hypothetical protein